LKNSANEHLGLTQDAHRCAGNGPRIDDRLRGQGKGRPRRNNLKFSLQAPFLFGRLGFVGDSFGDSFGDSYRDSYQGMPSGMPENAAKREGFSRCERGLPQRLKPDFYRGRYGTPEGVP